MIYKEEIKKIDNLNVEDIVKVAAMNIPERFRMEPFKYRDTEGRWLEHGTAILATEELCSAYMAAYGRMHNHKLNFAFSDEVYMGNFPYDKVANGVEVFDWGCGQGIGTLSFIDHLKNKGLLSNLHYS